jgi:hypothetical protein
MITATLRAFCEQQAIIYLEKAANVPEGSAMKQYNAEYAAHFAKQVEAYYARDEAMKEWQQFSATEIQRAWRGFIERRTKRFDAARAASRSARGGAVRKLLIAANCDVL